MNIFCIFLVSYEYGIYDVHFMKLFITT